jgi:hypothetical protein
MRREKLELQLARVPSTNWSIGLIYKYLLALSIGAGWGINSVLVFPYTG